MESTKTPRRRPADDGPIFKALADANRRRIMQLITREELTVTELVSILRMPQSTVSRHLRVLRDASLLRDRRDGTATLCRAASPSQDRPGVQDLLLTWLQDHPLDDSLRARLERTLERRRRSTVGFFDRLGKRWDDLRTEAFGDGFAFEAMLSLLPHEWTVADIGTGTGYLLPILAAHFERVIAVDPAQAMLDCARRRVVAAGAPNVSFHLGDLGRVPMADGSCDLAIACLVLHHVPEPPAALAEIRRVLRPNGRVMIVEQRSHENQAFYETMQDHWWGFEPDELVARMTATGFGRVRYRELQTAEGRNAMSDAPGLFVLVGERG